MSEVQSELAPRRQNKLMGLLSKYRTKRQRAGQILEESGIEPGTGPFKKARKRFAGELLMADHDKLTGLLTREAMEERIKEEINRARRIGYNIGLMYIDLNWLKETNDTIGHAEGDRKLRGLAGTLIEAFRSIDISSRWGGDEFLVLLPNTDSDGIMAAWNRLSPLLEMRGVSVGAGATMLNLNNPEQSIEDAEEAMYKAKTLAKQGGERANRIMFNPTLRE